MNNHIVVGVGNIYASEALFKAKISPLRQSNTLSLAECQSLVKCIKEILIQAIKLGGSTLRDYKQTDGSLGYFQNFEEGYTFTPAIHALSMSSSSDIIHFTCTKR